MDTWRVKRAQQPCRLRKDSAGRLRKQSWIFRLNIFLFVFCGFYDIDYPGICWTQPDRSCGWEDARNDGDTKVKIYLPS